MRLRASSWRNNHSLLSFKKFVPQLAAIVRKWQYQNQTCFADVRLRPTDYPVAKGQFIAVSGNTGASKAPHHHLEFHSTKTWDFLDPWII